MPLYHFQLNYALLIAIHNLLVDFLAEFLPIPRDRIGAGPTKSVSFSYGGR